MSRGVRRGAICLAAAALVLGPVAPAAAQEFRLPSAVIDVSIRPDGSFDVREERTFDFDGSFHRAFITIPLRGRDITYEISAATVSERGAPYRFAQPGPEESGTFNFTKGSEYEIRWFFDGVDEQRVFTITYHVTGAIVAYDDVAEFNWKLIGDRGEVATDRLIGFVHLPSGATRTEIDAWAHGPLEGEVQIRDAETIRWDWPGIPPRTFAEARVAFPPRLVPSAPRLPGSRLPAIVAEEERLADEANRARSIARAWNIAAPVLALASFGLFLWLFFRYGKEPDVPDPGRYLRELPAEYPPAVVGYLMRFGGVKPVDMVATLMDLARRGFLKVEEETEEAGLIFKRTERHYKMTVLKREGELENYERELIELLDEAGMHGSIREDELKDWAKENPTKMQKSFRAFQREVNAHADRLDLIEERGLTIFANLAAAGLAGFIAVSALGRQGGEGAIPLLIAAGLVAGAMFFRNSLVAVIVLLVGAVGMAAGATLATPIRNAPGALAATVLLAIQVGLTPVLRRRTLLGATQYTRWKAFQRFLKDLTRLKDYRPTAIVMWEQYLVYAIPLGAAAAVTNAIALNAPEVARQGFTWYAWSGGHGGIGSGDGFASSLSSFTSSFTASAQAAFATAPSSGGGGGGGASGGGGGGGGGGSAGAS